MKYYSDCKGFFENILIVEFFIIFAIGNKESKYEIHCFVYVFPDSRSWCKRTEE